MLGQPVKSLPNDTKFDLDAVWGFLWGSSVNSQPISSVAPKVNICSEAVVVLLVMARTLLHSDQRSLPEWLKNHPISIIQVLFQLYHNMPDFMPVFMSAEVLGALAGVLFPPPTSSLSESGDSSGASTPAAEETPDCLILIPKTPIEEEVLTVHPARQFIIDFIRVC